MIYSVIGLGFGDEGKGFTTDYLCHLHPNSIVVRFNGGHQAGHTVQVGDKRHVFSNFGSGTLRGVPTYWSEDCTIDPVGIMREYEALKEYKPLLIIDSNCPVTTPYDKFYNQLNASTIHHGTCGVGFGETLEREESHYSLRTLDLLFASVTETKLKLIKKYYADKYNRSVGKELDTDIALFLKAVRFLLESDAIVISEEISQDYENYIFEGAQGVLLDKEVGFFPHVTRSNTDYNAAQRAANKLFNCTVTVKPYFVTRAYQTRHGNGPMTNENLPIEFYDDIVETNKDSKYQGNFRRTLLDVDLLQYAIYKQKIGYTNSNLMITCLNHIKSFSYTDEGKVFKCESKEDFIEEISEKLPLSIDRILVSESVFSENVWRYQK